MATIHDAARLGDLAAVVRLVEEDAGHVHTPDGDGLLPLMLAAREGHLAIVIHLVDRGARVDDADWWQTTALNLACQNGNLEVAKLLVERGADPGIEDVAGRTPLMAASYGGHVEVVALLVSQKVTFLDAVDLCGETALHLAPWGHPGVVEVLLEAGRPHHSRRRGCQSTHKSQAVLRTAVRRAPRGEVSRRSCDGNLIG